MWKSSRVGSSSVVVRSIALSDGVPWFATMPSHFVAQRHHAALVSFDLREMEGDVPVELLEEPYPIANQDRQDRIANFVGEPETEAFAGNAPPPTNQMVRNVGRRRPFTNRARSPE